MKVKKILALIGLSVGIGFSGCNYLDIVPDNVATIDYAFRTRNTAESYLFTCYSWLPGHAASSAVPDFVSGDEIWLYQNVSGRPNWQIARGNQGVVNPLLNFWAGKEGATDLYRGIRECNIFLENIASVRDMTETERALWIGEVKFLKAYFHFYLMRMYGPIPIMRENLPISASVDEVKAVVRQPIDECVAYIINLLDEAAEVLPDDVLFPATEKGRVNKVIAKALKAKVLVTGASPLFNGNRDFSNFKSKTGVVFFNQTEDEQKWIRAANACREAIELCESQGYKLYTYVPAVGSASLSDTTRTELSFRGAITEKWNSEIIWADNNSMGNSLQRYSQPRMHLGPGYYSGVHAPPIKMAEQFYTKNGVPIQEDKNYPYQDRFTLKEVEEHDKLYLKPGERLPMLHFNREPRFYGSLAFDGGRWFGTGWLNDVDNAYVEARAGGKAAGHPTNYSVTGYWAKKLVNYLNTASDDNYVVQQYPFPLMRLPDLYLLYAEAANEAYGPSAEVIAYIDKVRERAGLKGVEESWINHSLIPEKFTTKEGLRDIIHQERLIELAFEGHRFWDLRRWKKSVEVLNQPILGWDIGQESPEEYYRPMLLFSQEFSIRDYLWPIQEAEILRNQNLVQAPGW
ncbi:RagB/SusD family nutrient uptake outer membrane protein [Sphingobacterium chuzhouense]|uniref:RagB/SusD family nutrient uptake outer membrane protein n=1 Tax=Sphingobacterium chuzhouense TaxID=1742264 RepID=A0ABR7XVM6_9SPHI|nr:RagB/SusD family nutrient uptake outer membrane protein [Sphingobacterium chuzhouense]MBD1423096.1 RagB/SusD family nutrient uptake outer membrane protein [Sphingobacterium chuzhouense]